MHSGQLSVSFATVRGLIAAQFPQWAGLSVQPVAGAGTANAVFRIGQEVVARFPIAPSDQVDIGEQLRLEASAAEELGRHTRFPVPRPLAIGEPGPGYPHAWSVYSWLPGDTATADNCAESDLFARDLGEFIQSVRSIATRGRTYDGHGRGGVLLSHDEWVQECLANSARLLDVPTLSSIWNELRELPRGDSPDVMSHGDLIPPNILTADGHLVGILDIGGFKAADPALDLVGAWHLLDSQRREQLRIQLGCDDSQWQRGCGWAFQQAIGAVWYYAESNPTMSTNCLRTLERIVAHMDGHAT
jgi:aminoglycoside phosphotransferase (APT) family kinase protein